MNIRRLLRIIDELADAPERMPALRKLILAYLLHSAVNSVDAILCAQSLREAHQARRRELAKSVGRNDVTSLDDVLGTDLPPGLTDIPASLFDRLGNIALIEKGQSQIQRTIPGKYPLVVTAEARRSSDSYDFEGPAAIVPLVSSTGHGDASLNRLHYQEGEYAVGNILAVVQPICPDLIRARFIYEYLTAFKEELLVSRMVGTANVSLTVNKLKEVPVPLVSGPVLSRIDELMALCDKLEQRQQARQHARGKLQQSALHHLLEAREPNSFATAWQLVRDHFHPLHDTPDAIPQLRQAILQLAVQGRLVPQNPKDEPASELVANVREQKQRLVALGKIQNEKQTKARNAKQALFPIPDTWQWARFSDLTELITKGSSPKWQGISYVGKDEGVLFITSENVGAYELRKLDELKYVEKRFNEIEPRSMLKFGDILMNLVGASIGRTAIYSLQTEANINQAVALIRLMPEITDEFAAFLLHYLNSAAAIEHMLSSQVVNAQPNISLTDARDFPVPIPPLAEQKRIVARVEELLRWCDTLEAQLHQTRTLGARLLDSTLHHLLAA